VSILVLASGRVARDTFKDRRPGAEGVMKAVVFEDTRRVSVEEVDDAVVEQPTDVVVRVTSSAICGTDLHMYDGRTGAARGLVIGHEPLGIVE
jgi:glutathione-independent formaldehyde dehydrogenase